MKIESWKINCPDCDNFILAQVGIISTCLKCGKQYSIGVDVAGPRTADKSILVIMEKGGGSYTIRKLHELTKVIGNTY